MKGVFISNEKSRYDDRPDSHYNFPKMYLKRAEAVIGDDILYYESGNNGGRKSYFGTAKVMGISEDTERHGRYYAHMAPGSYLDFPKPVPLRDEFGELRNQFIRNEDGTVNQGRQVWAIRQISDEDYLAVLNASGLTLETELPRVGEVAEMQAAFEYGAGTTVERVVASLLTNRKLRDRAFRTRVLEAYGKRCAFTGLSLINGGGRAEVQAAHIRPVAYDGPDSVNNGLALSGTVHWMFDRGLLGVSRSHEVLTSRHINNVDDVERLLGRHRTIFMPRKRSDWPHPDYLDWHRENVFKR